MSTPIAVRQMIAEADAEGGEIPFDEAIRELDKVIADATPLTWRIFSFRRTALRDLQQIGRHIATAMRLRRSDFEMR